MRSFTLAIAAITFLLQAAAQAGSGIPYHSKSAHKKVIEFAPGVISTRDGFEINTVFNQAGDKVIFARCDKDFEKCTLMQSEFRNGEWSEGVVLPFSGEYLDADPYYNADFSELYYISKRPIDDSGKATESINIWRVAVTDEGWGEPEYLANISSDANDLYPSLTNSGDLYFPSFRDEKRLMYVAKKDGAGFKQPEAIPAEIYGENANIGDSMISRDGSYMIYSISGRDDSKGRGDLYISRLVDGEWSVAESLGDVVNTSDHEFTPIMSPDGEYLFFTRIENGLGNLYQVHKSMLWGKD